MGMFDFMKNVGEKLGFGDDDDEAAKTAAVKKELESHKLGTDKVDVAVKGDKVILKGIVKDQSIFEKAVIAVGNTLGISKVEAHELKVVAPDSGLKLDGNVDMTALVAASTPAKEPVFYTVKKGDNLSKIAEKLWQGKGVEIHRDLRGQQTDAEASGQDLSRPGAAYPRSRTGLSSRAAIVGLTGLDIARRQLSFPGRRHSAAIAPSRSSLLAAMWWCSAAKTAST